MLVAAFAKAKKDRKDGQAIVNQNILRLAPYAANMEYRASVGPAAVHETEAEMFYVIDGTATMVTGGKLTGETRQNAENLQGTGIEGGIDTNLVPWIPLPYARGLSIKPLRASAESGMFTAIVRLERGSALPEMVHASQRGGRIGGKIRIRRAASENHHPAFIQVANGPAADIGLSHLRHRDRGHHARGDVLLFKSILQGQRVDDGGQHAHVIGADAVHVAGRCRDAAEEIAAAYHQADLHAGAGDFRDFSSQRLHSRAVQAE